MKEIHVDGIVPAGHYVPAILSNGTLYISGQLADDFKLDMTGQMAEVLSKIDRILTAAGCTRFDVAMCTVYIPDIRFWDLANCAYSAFFGTHKPARVIVPTRELHHGALVEISAVAEAH
jgi:2-iminobutanoate/2-iminopropanoate deaminase